MKVKEQQVEFYKSNFEEAEKMVEDLGEKLTAQNELLRQTKEILEEVRVEREEERAELQRQIEQRGLFLTSSKFMTRRQTMNFSTFATKSTS